MAIAFRGFWFLFILTSLACSLALPATPFPPSETLITRTSQEPTIQSTLTSTLPPAIPAPKATYTPPLLVKTPECVPPQPHPPLTSTYYGNYPNVIRDYLNQGGTPNELVQELYNLGVASQPVAVKVSDLTGDGKSDVVISIFNPESHNHPPEGVLLIYVCSTSFYEVAYQQMSDPGFGVPGIRYVQDLDADKHDEIVVSSPTCGAHTCFESVQVIGWVGDRFENRFVGSTTDLPYPDIKVEDSDRDQIYDIIITGSGFGSVGAGPQRNLTHIWGYDPSVSLWTQVGEIMGPSNFRIHILHDAEQAAINGDYPRALQLYGRVIHDGTLEDWIAPQKEREDLAAYALFKSAVIYLLQDQEDFALVTIEQLRSTYLPGNPRYAFVQMVEIFQHAYRRDGLSVACEEAREFAGNNAELVLTPLGSSSFGYGNPDYRPEDICPWE